eukprot:m.75774 g.75774  ORF g.75774 m.75774 type:complete len:127 (-) comp12521_c0_seq3:100-480(-)
MDDADGMFVSSLGGQAKKTKPKKRKNRLGQMARQRIAEKKHGNSAKHKVDPAKDAIRRQDVRKMQEKRKRKRERLKESGSDSGKGLKDKIAKQSGGNQEEVLHPSWQAKQKQSAVQSFQGTRIKFD